MIVEIQKQWVEMDKKDISIICMEYKISRPTADKYIKMTDGEIREIGNPRKSSHSRNRKGNDYVNIIYKMMRDGYPDDVIYHYLRYKGIADPSTTIWFYLSCLSQNNFPGRKKIYSMKMLDLYYPDDVTVIKRDELLRYLLTINPKIKKSETIDQNINLIKEYYPGVQWTADVFQAFHSALMGTAPVKMDEFLSRYTDSALKGFCDFIQKDIAPVKNAISLKVSSGFVEGNNNKFKLIKRIVYGRAKLVNLSKKCYLAFMSKVEGFELSKLI